jgi:hypothetical protein
MASQEETDLKEFDRLREEMDNRTELSNQLVSYELAALGAGLAVFDKFPDVLLGLAAISSFLWLLWIDHTSQIYKAAAYITLHLAVRLRVTAPGALGWERFLRDLDSGGPRAVQALYGKLPEGKPHPQLRPPQTLSVGNYITILFGGSVPVLIAIYAAVEFSSYSAGITPSHVVRILAAISTLALWGYAIWQRQIFNRLVDAIRIAILST